MLAEGSLCYGYTMDTSLMSLLPCGSCPMNERVSSYQNKSSEMKHCRGEEHYAPILIKTLTVENGTQSDKTQRQSFEDSDFINRS